MEPVRSRKIPLEELLAPTQQNPVTGDLELIPTRDRVRRISEHPDAARIVPSLDPQQVYGLIRAAGIDDAMPLVELASTEQLQAFVDFDSWKRDEFKLVAFTEWMEIFLQANDARFQELYETMDRQAFVLWFRETVAVYEWEADVDLLDRIEGNVYTSPCGQFALVIPEEESYGQEVRLFLERLYQLDVEEALTMMSEARWALSTDLEEELFQQRTARLSDYGFVPYDEALAVYGFLEPIRWAKAQRTRLQELAGEPVIPMAVGALAPLEAQLLAVQEALARDTLPWFARAIAQLSDVTGPESAAAALPSVMAQFRALAQRVLVADGGTPGDPEASMQASRRTLDTLSLGLELLAEGDDAISARALVSTPLRDIHRAGYSIGLQMQRQVRELVQRGNLSVTDKRFSLLTAEDAAMCEGLLQQRPVMSENTQGRFRTMESVQHVAGRLGQIAFAELLFFAWMGFDRSAMMTVLYDKQLNATPAELVSFRSLLATILLNRLYDQERALMPMSTEELDIALAKVRAESNPLSFLLDRARALVDGLRPADQPIAKLSLAFIAETVTWMIDEMLSHEPPTERKIAQGWVLLRPEGAAAPTHDRDLAKATVH